MAALTSDEIRTYENDGYVVPAWRVPEERIAVLSAAMEEVIEANAGTRPEQLPNIHITNGAGTHLRRRGRHSCSPSDRAMRKPRLLLRKYVEYQKRLAERTWLGLPDQEPPRIARRPQSPSSHARPSFGASS